MKRLTIITLLAFLTTGCDVLLPFFGIDPNGSETGDSTLKQFASEEELADYLTEQVSGRGGSVTTPGGMFLRDDDVTAVSEDAAIGGVGAAPTDSPNTAVDQGSTGGEAQASDGSFSTTTTQEIGVDEADVVKTDGTHVYVMSEGIIRIAKISPADELTLISETKLEGYGRELYLYDDKVVALTEAFGGFVYFDTIFDGDIAAEPGDDQATTGSDGSVDSVVSSNDAVVPEGESSSDESVLEPVDADIVGPGGIPPFEYTRPRTIITIIDVSDRSNPTVISQTKVDGTQNSSRMIDGMLHLVVANFQDYYFDVFPLLGRPEIVEEPIEPTAWLPEFEYTDAEGNVTNGELLTWEELYRPTDPDGFGLVAVMTVDVNDSKSRSAVGIVAEPGLIYSSREALYLTDTQYNFSGVTRETTDIYKLVYNETGSIPVAAGAVPGRILNQYSMGEHEGFLRVATTIGPTFSAFGAGSPAVNNVYVMEEAQEQMVVVGSVENIAPNETIQSARFIANKGYVVTFERVDPLFTLDLSVATNPRIIGELKVPGFSTFITPMDENHLLTVGEYIPEDGFFGSRGVQLSIFDVSDFENPTLAHLAVLGEETGAYSEALYNPKAFTYFAEAGLVALPVSIYERFDFPVILDDDVAVIGVEDEMGGTDAGSTDSADASPPPSDSGVSVDNDDPVIEEPPVSLDPYVPGGFEGLVVFSVSADQGFEELGRISTRFEDAGVFYSVFTRGVFVDDNVFAVTDRGVRGTPVDDMTSDAFELLFPLSSSDGPIFLEPISADDAIGPGVDEPVGDTATERPVP